MEVLWDVLHLLMWHLLGAERRLGYGVLHPRTSATGLPFIRIPGLLCTLSWNTIRLSLLLHTSPGPDLYQAP